MLMPKVCGFGVESGVRVGSVLTTETRRGAPSLVSLLLLLSVSFNCQCCTHFPFASSAVRSVNKCVLTRQPSYFSCGGMHCTVCTHVIDNLHAGMHLKRCSKREQPFCPSGARAERSNLLLHSSTMADACTPDVFIAAPW
eukprot:1150709-Pelagomonas_calceolata.AAC.3